MTYVILQDGGIAGAKEILFAAKAKAVELGAGCTWGKSLYALRPALNAQYPVATNVVSHTSACGRFIIVELPLELP